MSNAAEAENVFFRRFLFTVILLTVSAFLFLGLISGALPYIPALVLSSLLTGLGGGAIFMFALCALIVAPLTTTDKMKHPHSHEEEVNKKESAVVYFTLFSFFFMPPAMSIAYFFTHNPIFITLWHVPLITAPVIIVLVLAVSIMPIKEQSMGVTVGELILSFMIGCLLSGLPIASLILSLIKPVLVQELLLYYGIFMGLTVFACLSALLKIYMNEMPVRLPRTGHGTIKNPQGYHRDYPQEVATRIEGISLSDDSLHQPKGQIITQVGH